MNTRFAAFLFATAATVAIPAMAEDAKKEDSKPVAAAEMKDYTIIKVGDDAIKYSEVMETWNGLFQGNAAPDFASFDEAIRQNVLRGLVSERLIYQEALKAGTDKSEEVKRRMEDLRKKVVMQTFMENKAETLVSDADLKAAYEEKAKEAGKQEELKARHILVAGEEEAKKIAEELKKGGDFDKIAREKSTDKGSGTRGGDLGWFTKDKMVPEFGEAAFKLKKGEVSEPVKTAFGWHVIKVEDRRPAQLPPFAEMKEQLRAELTNQAVQNYVEGLLKKSDIKYYSADGVEKPFNRSMAPAAGKSKE